MPAMAGRVDGFAQAAWGYGEVSGGKKILLQILLDIDTIYP